MLIKEKPTVFQKNIRFADYSGTGNYVKKFNSPSCLPQIARLENAAFSGLIEDAIQEPTEVIQIVYPDEGDRRISDLPLASEFGNIGFQGLVFANLEGLQYYTKIK